MEQSEQAFSPGMQEFIESMGLYFGQYNLPRIGGRILALLMVAERPLSLDDMAQMLLVSRASVSTNMRLLTSIGMAEQVGVPGDRRDFYRTPPDSWGRAINIEIAGTRMLRRLVERGLQEIDPENTPARKRLVDTLDFCDMVVTSYTDIQRRWQERESVRGENPMST